MTSPSGGDDREVHVAGAARAADALTAGPATRLARRGGRLVGATLIEWVEDGAASVSARVPAAAPYGAALIILEGGSALAVVARRRAGTIVADVPAHRRGHRAAVVLLAFASAAERDRYVREAGGATDADAVRAIVTGTLVAREEEAGRGGGFAGGGYSAGEGYAVGGGYSSGGPSELETDAGESAEEAVEEAMAEPAEEAAPPPVPRMAAPRAPRPRAPRAAPPFGIAGGEVPRMAAPPEPAPEPGTAAEAARGPDGGRAEPVSAHIDAEMPGRLVRGERIDVTVRLSPVPLAATPGAAHAEARIPIDPGRPVDLVVVPRGLTFAPGHRSARRISLPPAGDGPAVVRVGLIPTDVGPAEVSVIVRQEPVELPLATLRITAPILAAADDDAAADLEVTAPVGGAAADIAGLPTLRVDESIAAGRSTLRIALVVGGERAERSVVIGDKVAFIDRIYRRLDGVRAAIEREPESGRAREAARQIADIGRVMTRALLRGDIADLLWRRRDDLTGLIVQTSGEIDLPWEIVTIDEPGAPATDTPRFLADVGVTRWVYDTAHPATITVRPDRVLAVAPQYDNQLFRLARTAEELDDLREHVDFTTAVVPRRTDLSGRIRGEFDLLHFAGHGRWRDRDERSQELLLASFADDDDQAGAYTDADARADLNGAAAASAPLVFLSACDVGRLRSDGPGLGGFAEAFLHGGAGAFIGCGWAVRDDVASQFVRTFYRAVFDDHLTIGEATAAARSAAGGSRDPSALAFAVFADPRSRLTTG